MSFKIKNRPISAPIKISVYICAMNLIVKVFAWIFGALCIVSAVLQYNDPDPLMWIIIYGISALLSFGFAVGKAPFIVLLLAGLSALVAGGFIFPEEFQGFEIGKGHIKNIEQGREAVGLFIVGVIQLLFAIWTRFWKKS